MSNRISVLYIDDEPENLLVFRSSFKREMDVYVANSVEEAWQVLEKEHIPIVISDQRMPVCTGTEFFTQLKDKKPDVIRILLTGYADFDDVIDAINEGKIYHYINKPWDRTQLRNVITNAFEVHGLQAQNKLLIEKLEAHNQILERRVKERTQELLTKNERLEEVNQELKELNDTLSLRIDENTQNLGFDEDLSEELEQKSKELASYSLQLIQKNKVLSDLKSELKQIMQSTESTNKKKFRSLVGLIDYSFNVEKEWNRFRQVFENVHKEFYNKLDKKHPRLTPSERKLTALFKLGLDSKEIADVLGISQDSLKTARHRLRKKLELESDDNLSTYINAI